MVGLHQNIIVIEEDVVDADDAGLAELRVLGHVGSPEEREVHGVVHVVVEIRARGHDPVDITGP